jgi:ubiquinone biosynthesis monooxygenase Coq7
MAIRNYSIWDKLCLSADQAVRALTHNVHTSGEPYPAKGVKEPTLDDEQRKHAAGLMRVNHAGEICAQALYHGQGVVSRSEAVQVKMQQAAIEEGDHLYWCQQRIEELGSHTSYLNPVWYAGSFCIGMVAGMIGDAWSLGFVVETERQVIRHLEGHMESLPPEDERSHKILKRMEQDEAKHRDEAIAEGARELPEVVKGVMTVVSKVMVKTAYWI